MGHKLKSRISVIAVAAFLAVAPGAFARAHSVAPADGAAPGTMMQGDMMQGGHMRGDQGGMMRGGQPGMTKMMAQMSKMMAACAQMMQTMAKHLENEAAPGAGSSD